MRGKCTEDKHKKGLRMGVVVNNRGCQMGVIEQYKKAQESLVRLGDSLEQAILKIAKAHNRQVYRCAGCERIVLEGMDKSCGCDEHEADAYCSWECIDKTHLDFGHEAERDSLDESI